MGQKKKGISLVEGNVGTQLAELERNGTATTKSTDLERTIANGVY